MEIRSDGGSDFRLLAGRFKAAGTDGAAIRKALTKTIQVELKKLIADQKREALAMKVKGTRGRGSARRALSDKSKRGRPHGLRATVARSIKSRVSYTGRKIGARVYVDKGQFPNSQRKLPRSLNRPTGWKHPTWGHRDRMVQQIGEPFFDRPIKRHRDEIRKAVDAAVTEVLRTLK